MTDLLSTPLEATHVELGATMTDFAGWNMPLRYGSATAEHEAVRSAAGMFDLSHMGQIRVEGPDAGRALDYALVSTPSAMLEGRARYSLMVDRDGGIIDDLIVYRNADDDFLVIANGANRVTVVEQLTERSAAAGLDVAIIDNTLSRALVAVQGPASARIVSSVIDEEHREAFDSLGYYRHAHLSIDSMPVHVARTGYTGERGYEIMIDANGATTLWSLLTEAGSEQGLVPCGLACRDSLRLEAGMPLYGNELSRDITPAEGGQGRVVKMDHDFVGRDALQGREAATTLYGLVGEGRRAARAGSEVRLEGQAVGTVTSGILSPTLGYPIALALARPGLQVGQHVTVDVRGKDLDMTVVELPFYTTTH